jgi:hypothetical protein
MRDKRGVWLCVCRPGSRGEGGRSLRATAVLQVICHAPTCMYKLELTLLRYLIYEKGPLSLCVGVSVLSAAGRGATCSQWMPSSLIGSTSPRATCQTSSLDWSMERSRRSLRVAHCHHRRCRCRQLPCCDSHATAASNGGCMPQFFGRYGSH